VVFLYSTCAANCTINWFLDQATADITYCSFARYSSKLFPAQSTQCAEWFTFDTGIGLKWEDVDCRRFMAMIRSAARTTSAGCLIPALVRADTMNFRAAIRHQTVSAGSSPPAVLASRFSGSALACVNNLSACHYDGSRSSPPSVGKSRGRPAIVRVSMSSDSRSESVFMILSLTVPPARAQQWHFCL